MLVLTRYYNLCAIRPIFYARIVPYIVSHGGTNLWETICMPRVLIFYWNARYTISLKHDTEIENTSYFVQRDVKAPVYCTDKTRMYIVFIRRHYWVLQQTIQQFNFTLNFVFFRYSIGHIICTEICFIKQVWSIDISVSITQHLLDLLFPRIFHERRCL